MSYINQSPALQWWKIFAHPCFTEFFANQPTFRQWEEKFLYGASVKIYILVLPPFFFVVFNLMSNSWKFVSSGWLNAKLDLSLHPKPSFSIYVEFRHVLLICWPLINLVYTILMLLLSKNNNLGCIYTVTNVGGGKYSTSNKRNVLIFK